MAARKKKELESRTVEQDQDTISSALERLADEMGILTEVAPELKDRYSTLELLKRIESARQLVKEGRFKGIKDTMLGHLKMLRHDIKGLKERTTKRIDVDGDGNDVTGRCRYVGLEGATGYAMKLDGTPYTEWVSSAVPLAPDEVLLAGGIKHATKPVRPMDDRTAAPTLAAIDALEAALKDAVRRHVPRKPMHMVVLERLAGQGPMKMRDICKIVHGVRLEYGGAPQGVYAKRGMADPQGVGSILYMVENPTQEGDSGLDSVWEVPKDFKLRPTYNETARTELEKTMAKYGITKPKTRQETAAVRERIIRLLQSLVDVMPPDAEIGPYSSIWAGGISGAAEAIYAELHVFKTSMPPRLFKDALLQGWPEARSRPYRLWTRSEEERARRLILAGKGAMFMHKHGDKLKDVPSDKLNINTVEPSDVGDVLRHVLSRRKGG